MCTSLLSIILIPFLLALPGLCTRCVWVKPNTRHKRACLFYLIPTTANSPLTFFQQIYAQNFCYKLLY